MKKILMVFMIFIFCIMVNSFTYNCVYAEATSLKDAIDGAKDFVKEGENESEGTIDQDTLKTASDTVYNILLAVGFICAIVVGVVLGIQFMMSGVDGQAEIKEKLIAYAIGCIIIFGAFGIWKIFVQIGQKF